MASEGVSLVLLWSTPYIAMNYEVVFFYLNLSVIYIFLKYNQREQQSELINEGINDRVITCPVL